MQNDDGFDLDSILKKHQGDTSARGFSSPRPPAKSLLDELNSDLQGFTAPLKPQETKATPLYTPETPEENTSATTLTAALKPSSSLQTAAPLPLAESAQAPSVAKIETTLEQQTTATNATETYAHTDVATPVSSSADLPDDLPSKPKRSKRKLIIALGSVLVLLVMVSLALFADLSLHKPDEAKPVAPGRSSNALNDAKISKASPFYFAGGQGYAVVLTDKMTISKLRFKSNLSDGLFELRATAISQPLGGTVLYEGTFTPNAEISFDPVLTGALILVYKEIPKDTPSVQITDVSVE